MRWIAVTLAAAGCTAGDVVSLELDPTASYDDRVAMLAILADEHPYPGAGTDGAWPDHRAGIVLQTEWQSASGRATRDGSGRVDGWWPNVNWTLSVWQFEAQQRYRGGFGDIAIVVPGDPRFALPEDVGRGWAEYYDAIDRAREDVAAGRLTPRQESERARELQQMMWDVHVAAVREGLARNGDRAGVLAPGEDRFAVSWGYTAVEFIAAANFPSDAGSIGRMQELLLPLRPVVPGDYDDAGPPDLTWHQHMAVHAMEVLHEVEAASDGILLEVWQNALAQPRCAALCPYLLDQGLYEGLDDLPAYLWDVIDWMSGIDQRPGWAANGEVLDCEPTGDGAMACSAAGEPLPFECSLATGVREWSCRTCLPDGSGAAMFTRMFCPDGTTATPGGPCEVLEAGRFASGACAS